MRKPHTLNDILELLPSADLWTYTRGSGFSDSLDLYFDDLSADERIIYRVRFPREQFPGSIEETKLYGYDNEKRKWANYREGTWRTDLTNKRGQKALMDYIWLASEKHHGYRTLPNIYTHTPTRQFSPIKRC